MSEAPQDDVAVREEHGGSSRKSAHRSRRHHRRTNWSWIIAIAAIGALGAAFAPGQPTGIAAIDVVERALLAFIVTMFAACSRRWAWLILAGVGTVLAETVWGHLVGLVALGFAVDAALRRETRDRTTGALIGALAMQPLLRTADVGFFGLTALLTGVAMVTVVGSGYTTLRKRSRRRVNRAAAAVVVATVLALIGFAVMASLASTPLNNGVAAARSGLDVAEQADQVGAAGYWTAANDDFVAANRHLSSLLVKLVYPIPVVSQHAQMAVAASSSGSAITSTAARAATVAPYQRLRTSDGAFDVEKIASMERPVENTITAMHDANARVDRTNSPWLLGPLRNRVSAYQKQLDRAVPQAQRALDAIRIAPEVLGGNGPRHYLLLFGNPAETRGLGGFVGAWAQLDATDGQLTLVRHGKMGDLNDATPWESRHITGEPEYMARYGALQPARYIQNISASPDFPTVARVAEQLYPQAGGIPVDGVMYIDPRGLAALLKLTGPVTVQDAPEKLTSANAARFLMHDQYVKVPGLGDRTDLLSNAAEATFKALTNRRLPTVSMITSVLSPAMHDLHIMATVNDPEANTYFTSIGLTGAFPKVKRKDFVSVRISNIGENKMDYFVNQASLYSVRHDVATGSTQGTLTTLIQNVGPESGLPDYVAGNPDTRAHRTNGRPYGSANVAVSIYTALQPTGMTIGGRPVGIQVQHELGYWVASVSTTVPEGVTNVLVLEVSGTIAPSADYHLVVANQPIATFPGTMVTYHPYDSRHRGARPQPPRVFFKPSGVYVFGPDGGSRWTN